MYIKYLFEQLLFFDLSKVYPLRDKDMSNNNMFFNELRCFDE
jgi:hypothetical protein